jgi:integrase/recombinase XerD
MKRLKKAARDYVALRRSLGYKLEWVPNRLADFIAFLKAHGTDHITVPLALEWAQQNQEVLPITAAGRLSCVRSFARYLSAIDPRTQIPPDDLLPYHCRRRQPHLYTDGEVRRLLRAARTLSGLRGATYYCLLGLLSVTGLRISEACNLRPQDVDLKAGLLTIVDAKFGKSRWVPIHPSTRAVLAQYARDRDQYLPRPTGHFFVSTTGRRLCRSVIWTVFHQLSRRVGLRGPTASHGPRLHDFRHRFAVTTLVNWYRSGQEIEPRLPILSTYLGHISVADTYWYLTLCPELMGLAVKRLERRWEVPA